MAIDPTRLYRGQGIVSIGDRNSEGQATGFGDLGNCTELTLSASTERIEHMESRTGKQFTDKVIEKMIKGEIQFICESTAVDNLKRYYYGSTTELVAATVTNESVVGYKGKKVRLSKINLSTFASLTNSAGTITYIRNTNSNNLLLGLTYDGPSTTFAITAHGLVNGQRVKLSRTIPTGFVATTAYYVVSQTANAFQLSATNGGAAVATATTSATGVNASVLFDYEINLKTGIIEIDKNSAINDGQLLKANYAAGASQKMAAFTETNKEVTLLFEGLNTAEEDAPVLITVYKVRLDPADSWQAISDDWTKFTIKGTVLYDSLQPDNKIDGRYWKVEQLIPAIA